MKTLRMLLRYNKSVSGLHGFDIQKCHNALILVHPKRRKLIGYDATKEARRHTFRLYHSSRFPKIRMPVKIPASTAAPNKTNPDRPKFPIRIHKNVKPIIKPTRTKRKDAIEDLRSGNSSHESTAPLPTIPKSNHTG